MNFQPRPPKLGLGAKASANLEAEDTGLRKVLRKEMQKTKRKAAQEVVDAESSSDGSSSDSDPTSRTAMLSRRSR